MRTLAFFFLAFGFSTGNAETITFDSARPGFIPPGWSISSPNSVHTNRWRVQADKTAPSRPYVLAQFSSRGSGQESSVALFDKNTCRDGDLSVTLKLVSGKVDQSAGLVWRFQDTANYYFALASSNRDRIGIYKKVNNTVSLVAHASVPHHVDETEWNLMKVVFRGSRFVLFFGHRKLIEAQDTTLIKAGKTGLWTKADTVAYFDNFRLDRKG